MDAVVSVALGSQKMDTTCRVLLCLLVILCATVHVSNSTISDGDSRSLMVEWEMKIAFRRYLIQRRQQDEKYNRERRRYILQLERLWRVPMLG